MIKNRMETSKYYARARRSLTNVSELYESEFYVIIIVITNTHTYTTAFAINTNFNEGNKTDEREEKKSKEKKILTSTRTRNNYDASSTFVYLSRVYLRSICRARRVYSRHWHRKR